MFDFRRARPLRGVARTMFLTILVLAAPAARVRAEDTESQLRSLRREVETLRQRDEENRARMAEMERLLREMLEAGGAAPRQAAEAAPVASQPSGPTSPAPASPAAALDRALAASPAAAPAAGAAAGDIVSADIGGGAARARLIDISINTLAAAGGSSVDDDELGGLQGGAHDPDQNGFTLQQAELSLTGAVDPYFSGEVHLIATPGGVELEEAFFQTTALPWGLQVEGGYFFTEFGLLNPLHPHAWDWIDQPVVNTRMFGGDGLRSPGMRLGWLLPTPFFSELHVGVQNADEGELTASFMGEESVGGRPVVDREVDSLGELAWLGRWNASFDLSETSALLVGTSVLYGPNSTGPDGETWIYGGDVKLRWRARNSFRGWPFLVWQTEVTGRDYKADGFVAGTDTGGGDDDDDHHGHDDEHEGEESESPFPNDLPSDTLRDFGLYSQLLYGFRYGWAAGLRLEYANGNGASVAAGVLSPRGDDPLRDERVRISPLVVWHPTEFSRLRLQYNYDDADHLTGGDAHTIWAGVEVLYGKHAAHKY
jgi:hypothetical protein